MTGQSSTDRVATLIALFPGPLTLHVSRRKWLLLTAASLVLLVASVAHFGRTWWGAVFFGICTLVGIVALVPGASGLTLDADRFVLRNLFRRHAWRWSDVDAFVVIRVGRTPIIGFDVLPVADGPSPSVHVRAKSRTGALPDTYGLSAGDLVRLMALWRDRSVTGKT